MAPSCVEWSCCYCCCLPGCLPASGFLDRLRIELRLQGQLQGLDLKPGLVQQLLKQRSTANAEVNELRLDLAPMKQVSGLACVRPTCTDRSSQPSCTPVVLQMSFNRRCVPCVCFSLQGSWLLRRHAHSAVTPLTRSPRAHV